MAFVTGVLVACFKLGVEICLVAFPVGYGMQFLRKEWNKSSRSFGWSHAMALLIVCAGASYISKEVNQTIDELILWFL